MPQQTSPVAERMRTVRRRVIAGAIAAFVAAWIGVAAFGKGGTTSASTSAPSPSGSSSGTTQSQSDDGTYDDGTSSQSDSGSSSNQQSPVITGQS